MVRVRRPAGGSNGQRRRQWGLTGPGEGRAVFTTYRVLVGLPMSKADSCTTLLVSAIARSMQNFDVSDEGSQVAAGVRGLAVMRIK